MLKTIYLFSCLFALSQEEIFENKVITNVRHGIEKNLDYIESNLQKINIDCLFGVALAAAIIKDAYKNGSHVMDKSSLKLIDKSIRVLEKGIPVVEKNNTWITEYILDYKIWQKDIDYKFNRLELIKPSVNVLQNMVNYQNPVDGTPTTDFCLQNIVNQTITLGPNKCIIDQNCWNSYYVDNRPVSGYILTHKLLLLQLAKARKCFLNKVEYEGRTRRLCQMIYSEISSGDYFEVLDDMFDLFLEEITLCGYEGYTEFLRGYWLYYILKSQRPSGCFPAILTDRLKTRIRRNINTFEDGCSDHTTGLGVAVLSLYYNFIIKENVKNIE